MALGPLLAAPPLIQLHVAVAATAVVLGAYQLLAVKGTTNHRRRGWIWVVLMALVAGTSLMMVSNWPLIGPFGPIHALSAFALLTLPIAVLHARRHRVARHRFTMLALYFGGLVVTGLFTLFPGRLMYHVVFGE